MTTKMEDIDTPCPAESSIMPIDPITISENLFKDYPIETTEKLQTFLRIRPLRPNQPCSAAKKPRLNFGSSQVTQSISTNSTISSWPCFTIEDNTTLKASAPPDSKAYKNQKNRDEHRIYNFTYIFDEKTTQASFYYQCALPMVKRFLQGENCLLFAYGTTSSGKSYTMQGTPENPGIIPRALSSIFKAIGTQKIAQMPYLKPKEFCSFQSLSNVEQMDELALRDFIINKSNERNSETFSSISSFKSLQESTQSNSQLEAEIEEVIRSNGNQMEFLVWVSFIELYNEVFQDLLAVRRVHQTRNQNLKLLHDSEGNHYINNLKKVFVSSPEEALRVLHFGRNYLNISSTSLNKNSSRSHCCFAIQLVAFDKERGTVNRVNNLSFCDLAGSERTHKTQTAGERLKEAGKINASLMALSRCIHDVRHNQLKEKNTRHVAFRDSKLTQMFESYLNGKGVVNMIITLNPEPMLYDETIHALSFSAVASEIKVNTDESRDRLKENLKRLTHIWLQSTQRWSQIQAANPRAHESLDFSAIPAPGASTIIRPSTLHTVEEGENEDDDETSEETQIDINTVTQKLNEISQIDVGVFEAKDVENLLFQIEELTKALEEAEAKAQDEKIEMELKLRQQFAMELEKTSREIEQMAKEKEIARRRIEELNEKRLDSLRDIYHKEKARFDQIKEDLENQLMTANEKYCECEAALEKERTKSESLARQLEALKNEKPDPPAEPIVSSKAEAACSTEDLVQAKTFVDAVVEATVDRSDFSAQCEILRKPVCQDADSMATPDMVEISCQTHEAELNSTLEASPDKTLDVKSPEGTSIDTISFQTQARNLLGDTAIMSPALNGSSSHTTPNRPSHHPKTFNHIETQTSPLKSDEPPEGLKMLDNIVNDVDLAKIDERIQEGKDTLHKVALAEQDRLKLKSLSEEVTQLTRQLKEKDCILQLRDDCLKTFEEEIKKLKAESETKGVEIAKLRNKMASKPSSLAAFDIMSKEIPLPTSGDTTGLFGRTGRYARPPLQSTLFNKQRSLRDRSQKIESENESASSISDSQVIAQKESKDQEEDELQNMLCSTAKKVKGKKDASKNGRRKRAASQDVRTPVKSPSTGENLKRNLATSKRKKLETQKDPNQSISPINSPSGNARPVTRSQRGVRKRLNLNQ